VNGATAGGGPIRQDEFTIATWNVNSLRVRSGQLHDWLRTHQPDVVALQETKIQDPDFPHAEFTTAGYHSVFSGQKTYNGVALLSRHPMTGVLRDKVCRAADELLKNEVEVNQATIRKEAQEAFSVLRQRLRIDYCRFGLCAG